jgi:hypothetical protein
VADVVEVGRTGARFGSSRNRGRWDDVEPDVDQPEPGEAGHDDPAHALAPEVGRTGARFGSAKARRYRWQRDDGDDGPVEVAHEPPPEVGRTGARFGTARRHRAEPLGTAEPAEADAAGESDGNTQPMPVQRKPLPPPPPRYPEDDLDDGEEPSSLVRPYARTGGRTETSRELRLETLISVERTDVVLVMEHRRIVEICERTSSVAEVAAALPAPLGVARVLIDDLIELGVLTVHTGDSRPDAALLARVLAGLRRL